MKRVTGYEVNGERFLTLVDAQAAYRRESGDASAYIEAYADGTLRDEDGRVIGKVIPAKRGARK